MIESRNVQAILYFFLIVIVLEGDSRRPWLKEERQSERRDYRPSKWVANSAMDVWYGNKSMVDILSREFSDIMNRVALRPVRSPVSTEINSDVIKLTEYKLADESKNQMISKDTKVNEYNLADQARNDIGSEVTKLTENNNEIIKYDNLELARMILLRKLNATISKVISDIK